MNIVDRHIRIVTREKTILQLTLPNNLLCHAANETAIAPMTCKEGITFVFVSNL